MSAKRSAGTVDCDAGGCMSANISYCGFETVAFVGAIKSARKSTGAGDIGLFASLIVSPSNIFVALVLFVLGATVIPLNRSSPPIDDGSGLAESIIVGWRAGGAVLAVTAGVGASNRPARRSCDCIGAGVGTGAELEGGLSSKPPRRSGMTVDETRSLVTRGVGAAPFAAVIPSAARHLSARGRTGACACEAHACTLSGVHRKIPVSAIRVGSAPGCDAAAATASSAHRARTVLCQVADGARKLVISMASTSGSSRGTLSTNFFSCSGCGCARRPVTAHMSATCDASSPT